MPAPAPAGRSDRLPRPAWISLKAAAVKALLAAPTLAKTPHFVLQVAAREQMLPKLPTAVAPDRTESVDNYLLVGPRPLLGLALVVPKRHAKRAVTRNLVKRQMREAVRRRHADWASDQLLIRQRAPFSTQQFPAAASRALRQAVRGELDRLFDLAAQAR